MGGNDGKWGAETRPLNTLLNATIKYINITAFEFLVDATLVVQLQMISVIF